MYVCNHIHICTHDVFTYTQILRVSEIHTHPRIHIHQSDMRTYIPTWVHTYMHAYMHSYIHAYSMYIIHTYKHAYVCLHMYIRTYV